jgi:hypothetical protein
MAMEFTKLTLANVFEAARSKYLGDPGRSIRMEKKADGKLEIGTWSADKGHDWNPLKGYLEKKELVKKIEEEIDKTLGKKAAGKALTKQVGAYKRTFFKNSLPKLNMEQIEELQSLVEAAKIPKDFESISDGSGVKWTKISK